MERFERSAVLLRLIESLKRNGSWCGETHIQKSTFFLQELLKVPLDFRFILYKYGPYSFDLSDEVTSMRADGFLELELRVPYGPSIAPTSLSKKVMEMSELSVRTYEQHIDYVAQKIGNKSVAELERLATGLFVSLQETTQNDDVDLRARRMHELKPHVTIDQARDAVRTADAYIKEVRESELAA